MRITKSWVLLSSALTLALTGCLGGGAATKPDAPRAAVAECVFPDSPSDTAPLWVCTESIEGAQMAAVGSHEKSAAGVQFMKDMAIASARMSLAAQVKTSVAGMIKQYAATTGAGTSETVDKVNSNVAKLFVDGNIEGSRLYRSTTSPKGSIYVLVGIDSTTAKQVTEKAIKTSMGHDSAMYQQYLAKKAHEELADAVKTSAERK